MTVSYTLQVATCTGLGCFWRLLFRWRGSTWKLLWPNLVAFIVLVVVVSFIHHTALNDENKLNFEKLARNCKRDKDMIPMAFILGFYVNLVITRWFSQYFKMPWPDGMALYISTLIYGQDDRGRLIRRTLIRYCNLALVLTLRLFSTRIQRRFPTYDHLVDAGFLQKSEKLIFEHVDQKTRHPKYWMPLVWAGGIMVRARREGRIRDDFSLMTLVDALNTFRGQCGGMIDYDWICIPLVYTQVVTLAVYAFIFTSVVGSQAVPKPTANDKTKDDHFQIYVPIFSFMQLLFYMGWLKVAESLVNPWGDDDDDFEVNWMVDRHLQVSYMIVDEMHQEHPEMLKDQYWDEVFPAELPYTIASKQFNYRPTSHSSMGADIDSLIMQKKNLTANNSYSTKDDIEEENASDFIDIDESEFGIRGREESRPVKIGTEAKNSRTDLREKRQTRSVPTESRMLYETDSYSFSSLTELFPDPEKPWPKEDVMFEMSDVSVTSGEVSKEEVEVFKEGAEVDETSLDYDSRHGLTIPTDLMPVDLSAPSTSDIDFSQLSWSWTPRNEYEIPLVGLEEDNNQRPIGGYSPTTRVVVPTGEPVRHTFGPNAQPYEASVPTPSENVADRHVQFTASTVNVISPGEAMMALVSPASSRRSSSSAATTSPATRTSATPTRALLTSRVIDVLYDIYGVMGSSATSISMEGIEERDNPDVAVRVDRGGPYVPTPAIPVPGNSQAHATSPPGPSDEERDMKEAAMAARRGFHELESITEQTEANAGSAQKKKDKSGKPPESDPDKDGPSSP